MSETDGFLTIDQVRARVKVGGKPISRSKFYRIQKGDNPIPMRELVPGGQAVITEEELEEWKKNLPFAN